jgi:hypothetical protein
MRGHDEHQFDPQVPQAPAWDGSGPAEPRQPPGLLCGGAGGSGQETAAGVIGAYVTAAIALFLFGALIGFVAVISMASHRDKDIMAPARDRLARGARVAYRLHTRGPGVFHEAAYRHDAPRPPDRSDREWWL